MADSTVTSLDDVKPGTRWIVTDCRLTSAGRTLEVVTVGDDWLEWKWVDDASGKVYGTTSMSLFLFMHSPVAA